MPNRVSEESWKDLKKNIVIRIFFFEILLFYRKSMTETLTVLDFGDLIQWLILFVFLVCCQDGASSG